MRSKTVAIVPALVLLLLGACAQTETTQAKQQENQAPAQTAARSDQATAASAAPAAMAVTDQKSSAGNSGFTDHTVIEFDAKSRKLGDDARESIALLGGSAQRAKKIVIIGYCDKHSASNAKEVALFRAMTVKNELVNLGALEKNIRVKYVTAQAKHEVTIDLTER